MSARTMGHRPLLIYPFVFAITGTIYIVMQSVESFLENQFSHSANVLIRDCIHSEATLLHQFDHLEFKANELLRQSEQVALSHPPAESKDIHYKASRFQLSMGRSSSFTFTIQNIEKPDLELNESSFHNLTDRISCPLSIKQIPHFAQIAFPCWSVLQRFPNARRFVEVDARRGGAWITDFLKVFESDDITVIDNVMKSEANYSSPQWRVILPRIPSGWQEKSDSDFYFDQGNPFYFGNHADVQSFQKHVLADQFETSSAFSLPLRVLIVQRKGFSRDWIHAEETAQQIEKEWGETNAIEVKHLPNPEGSLQNQALEFHRADIIVSPHGAQLTNLAYIRPCTSVLELFPVQYYLAFYQPYVLSAGGISFEGYPFGREPLHDSKETGNVGAGIRGQLREKPMMASAESILRAFPRLVLSTLSCKRAYQNIT